MDHFFVELWLVCFQLIFNCIFIQNSCIIWILQDYNQILHDLSDLQRADRDRRQKIVANIPVCSQSINSLGWRRVKSQSCLKFYLLIHWLSKMLFINSNSWLFQKQVFEPPHRRLEDLDDRQKDMEEAFEDMYMANTSMRTRNLYWLFPIKSFLWTCFFCFVCFYLTAVKSFLNCWKFHSDVVWHVIFMGCI